MIRILSSVLLLLLSSFLFGQNSTLILEAHAGLKAKQNRLLPSQKPIQTQLISRNGIFLVEGTMNGNQKGWFILDTGSPGLLLNQTIDKDQADGFIGGATGLSPFQDVKVAKLQIAGLEQKKVAAIAVDLSFIEKTLGEDLLGIIGYDQLSKYPVKISPRNSSLSFGEFATESSQINSDYTFEMIGHLPVLHANVGKQDLKFAFDTGSGANVIDQVYYQSIKDHLRGRPSTTTFSGVDNHPQTVTCGLVKLTMLEEEVHTNTLFVFASLDEVNQEEHNIAGLLGPSFWKNESFILDYQAKSLTTIKH